MREQTSKHMLVKDWSSFMVGSGFDWMAIYHFTNIRGIDLPTPGLAIEKIILSVVCSIGRGKLVIAGGEGYWR